MSKSSAKTPPRNAQDGEEEAEEEERGGFGIQPAKTLKTGSCLEVFGIGELSWHFFVVSPILRILHIPDENM